MPESAVRRCGRATRWYRRGKEWRVEHKSAFTETIEALCVIKRTYPADTEHDLLCCIRDVASLQAQLLSKFLDEKKNKEAA